MRNLRRSRAQSEGGEKQLTTPASSGAGLKVGLGLPLEWFSEAVNKSVWLGRRSADFRGVAMDRTDIDDSKLRRLDCKLM